MRVILLSLVDIDLLLFTPPVLVKRDSADK